MDLADSHALPQGWTATTLGGVVESGVSQLGPQIEPFLYVDISSIDNKTKRIVDPRQLSSDQAPSRARQRLLTGDVVVSMTRPNLNAVALVPDGMTGAISSTGFHVLRAVASVPQFLLYLVQSHDFVEAMTKLVQGALYPAVRPKDINTFGFALPPLPEQTRIVAEIERQFSLLDAGVANLRRVQATLKRYRASVLQAACEGRLVPTEAALAQEEGRDYEPAAVLLTRILAERRARWESEQSAKMEAQGKLALNGAWKAKYQEPAAPDTKGLAALPEGWVWTTLGQAFGVYVGATPSRAEASYWGGDVRWVSSGEVAFCRINDTRETITDAGLANTSTAVHPLGTVLLGMIGEGKTRGQVAILNVSACNNQNCAAIRVSETNIPPELVYRYLEGKYAETRRSGSGNNQPALNKTSVSAMPFPLPPLEEQKRIVAEMERSLSVVDNLEQVVKVNLKRAERLRQAVLKEAFAGRLVPQDPADEPASVLLERIKAEREAQARTPAKAGRRKEKGNAEYGHADAAGKTVPSGHAQRKRGAADQARLQPDLFSANGG
jgi:type I restriction enzyme S subunit